MPETEARRSSRRRRTNKPSFRWRNLSHIWRRQYLDLGHCRLTRCTRRLMNSRESERDELRSTGLSFVAMAISAAASTSGTSREEELVRYARAAMNSGLNMNDSYNGDSAIVLSSYHGFTGLLALLLDADCPLKRGTSRNSIFAAVQNGQHEALELILRRRPAEALKVVQSEELIYEESGMFYSSLLEAITKADVTSVQLLMLHGCATLSDLDAKCLKKPRLIRRFESVLRNIYPYLPSVMHWRGELHWSFPTTDRQTLNWFWHAIHHPSCTDLVPDEIWLRVFSFVGRGWWACRRYEDIGPGGIADVDERNIISA